MLPEVGALRLMRAGDLDGALRLGRTADADAAVENALGLRPGSADAYDALAYVSLGLGRRKRANELYRRAVELEPRRSQFWYNLASSERSFGRLEAAESACDRAIALDTREYRSYLSRLLLVTRSPPDSCFAMYRTLFGEAYPFSYDFDDLARYYAAYARLMTHWRLTLGDAVHEISYEQLVTDPVHAGSRAAAMCGLAWKDSAIELEKNSTVSLTASAAQARRPIYTTSLGRWRHYRAHLAPLVERLRRLQVPFSSDV